MINEITFNPYRIINYYIDKYGDLIKAQDNYDIHNINPNNNVYVTEILGELEFNQEVLNNAVALLKNEKYKNLNSLFWFHPITKFDFELLYYLEEGDLEKIKDILEKHAYNSSIKDNILSEKFNIALTELILCFSKNTSFDKTLLNKSLKKYTELFAENNFWKSIIKERNGVDRKEIVYLFYEIVFLELSKYLEKEYGINVGEFNELLSEFVQDEKYQNIIKSKIIGNLIDNINSFVSQTENEIETNKIESFYYISELSLKISSYINIIKYFGIVNNELISMSDNLTNLYLKSMDYVFKYNSFNNKTIAKIEDILKNLNKLTLVSNDEGKIENKKEELIKDIKTKKTEYYKNIILDSYDKVNHNINSENCDIYIDTRNFISDIYIYYRKLGYWAGVESKEYSDITKLILDLLDNSANKIMKIDNQLVSSLRLFEIALKLSINREDLEKFNEKIKNLSYYIYKCAKNNSLY